MNKHTFEMIERLKRAGISDSDAWHLRRIAMTLHRWHELERGDGNDWQSWVITRGHKQNGTFLYSDHGKPYLEIHRNAQPTAYESVADRETGAKKRLAKIMARYPDLRSYVQGDPRGASLYIVHHSNVPEGESIDAYYSRGIAVYK
jgi:hypothetical protein